jgi:hypothetical protein
MLEQAFQYVSAINAAAAAANVANRIVAAAFDGEDYGVYGTDALGLCEAYQAADKFVPAMKKDVGIAKGPSTTTLTYNNTAAYPELYWIGELDDCACPQECKFTATCSDSPSCTSVDCTACYDNCRNTVYSKYLNDPSGLLNNMTKWYKNYISSWQAPGTWPMFSTEMLDANCVAKTYGSDTCGTFNGFGLWTWEAFESYMTLFATTYNISTIAVYEWQFIPPSWLNGTDQVATGSSTGTSGSSTVSAAHVFVHIALMWLVLFYCRIW